MLGFDKKHPEDKWNAGTFGKRIREARGDLTQKELADRIHKKQESISDLERGRTEVGAFDLVGIAVNLGKKITFFYEDYPSVLPTPELSHDEEDLIFFFRQIEEPAMKKLAISQVKRLADISVEADNEALKRRRELIAEELRKVKGKGLAAADEAGRRGEERFEEEQARKKKRT